MKKNNLSGNRIKNKKIEITNKKDNKSERTTYRNLFEKVKPSEKEKIKEKLNKKEISDYNKEEEDFKKNGN